MDSLPVRGELVEASLLWILVRLGLLLDFDEKSVGVGTVAASRA
jgi:hypothetical protein